MLLPDSVPAFQDMFGHMLVRWFQDQCQVGVRNPINHLFLDGWKPKNSGGLSTGFMLDYYYCYYYDFLIVIIIKPIFGK